jgi:hypothetical protein
MTPRLETRRLRMKRKVQAMAFEGGEAELGMLLGKMRNAPEDWHELCEQVRQTLNQMKATGMPLPQDLEIGRASCRERVYSIV